jgi:hypothetical protein
MRFEIGHAILSLIVLTAVMSGGGLGLASDTVVDGGERFPRLIASNLEKRTFTLPDDFEGSRNLLVCRQNSVNQQIHEFNLGPE